MEPTSPQQCDHQREQDQIAWAADSEAIRSVVYRYCAAIDRCQYQWLDAVFHPHAVITIGDKDTPLSNFVDELRARQRAVAGAFHMIGNVLIERAGADVAYAESYGLALEQRPASGDRPASDRILRLRYADRFDRRNRNWKISHRVLVLDHVTALPPNPRSAMSDGRRDTSDPSIQFRLSLGLNV